MLRKNIEGMYILLIMFLIKIFEKFFKIFNVSILKLGFLKMKSNFIHAKSNRIKLIKTEIDNKLYNVSILSMPTIK